MACHEQVGQSSQNIDFAVIFGEPFQLSFLKAELLLWMASGRLRLDHPKGMLSFGAYMGFCGFH